MLLGGIQVHLFRGDPALVERNLLEWNYPLTSRFLLFGLTVRWRLRRQPRLPDTKAVPCNDSFARGKGNMSLVSCSLYDLASTTKMTSGTKHPSL